MTTEGQAGGGPTTISHNGSEQSGWCTVGALLWEGNKLRVEERVEGGKKRDKKMSLSGLVMAIKAPHGLEKDGLKVILA